MTKIIAALATLAVVAVLVPVPTAFRAELWGLGSLHYAEFARKMRARVAPGNPSGFLVSGEGVRLEAPAASVRGGAHDGAVVVALTASPGAGIYYTLDGSIPVQHHRRYTRPISIDKTTVLRFRSYRSGFMPSETVTETYLLGSQPSLPVISLVVDPVSLWNKYSGIYENMYKTGPKWERDADVQVFTAGREQFRLSGRVRVHGGASRGKPKKSFRFRFEPATLPASLPSGIWSWATPERERTVVIRAGGSNVLYRLRDELFHSIYAEVGGFTSAFEPGFVYLNGEPWGIYDVREYIDNEYLQRHFGTGTYDLIVDQGIQGDIVAGDREHWDRTLQFFEAEDFTSDAAVARAAKLMDLDNLTDYWLLNIYAANLDWPHHNVFSFRKREGPDQRWKWIAWDADATFNYQGQGLEHDTLSWATRDRLRDDLRFNNEKGKVDTEGSMVGTLIVRKLLQNAGFRKRFFARCETLLQTHLRPERVEAHLDALVARVSADLYRDWVRWEIEPAAYARNLEQIRDFVRRRPDILRAHLAAASASLR